MKYFVKSKVLMGNEIMFPYSLADYNTDKELTVAEIKSSVKNFYTLPNLPVIKEVLLVNNKEVADDYKVPFRTSLDYVLTLSGGSQTFEMKHETKPKSFKKPNP
jgi:hypothetical protein